MSNDPTIDLNSGGKLDHLIALVEGIDQRLQRVETRLDSLEGRFNDLETKVDKRLRETQPIWEAVQSQIKEMDVRLKSVETLVQQMDGRLNKLNDDLNTGLRKVEGKIRVLNDNFLALAGDQSNLERRVEDLESKVS